MDLDYNEIFTSLTALVPPNSVFELRLLGDRKGKVDSGYFNNVHEAATAIMNAGDYYRGIYFTPNPVTPDALGRSHNRITPWAQVQTTDKDIVRRRWLLIDVDAIRLSGISSTEQEHQAALFKARQIAATLSTLYGFPDPVFNDSGNGAHLLYPMDEENSDEVRDEIHTFLRTLRAIYSDRVCDIDVTVYNAARIWRVPGTWARKGDSLPDRPHRRARIVSGFQNGRLSIVQVIRYNWSNKHVIIKATERTSVNGAGGVSTSRREYPNDETLYKRLNEFAMHNLKSWVPHFFPSAREYKEGYRISSADIGEHYEEDLTIHPWPLGIKYFGVGDQGDATDGRRTPISVISQYGLHVQKDTAARALSDHLNFPISEFGALPPPNIGHNGGPPMEGLLGSKQIYNFATIRNVQQLKEKQFKEPTWVIKNVLPSGNILLAARPKMRKTWLALQLSVAIVTGGRFLQWECVQGEVLFLALEDNERRIQNRIRTLQRFEIAPPDLSGFRYWTGGMDYDASGRLRLSNPEEAAATLQAFPKGDAGVDALDQYLDQYPKTTTIVIDTLPHFRGERTSRDIYQADYESMMPLTKLASRRNVLVIPVMHEKKGLADRDMGADFLEDVTGSAGITGGSDGVISIKGRRGVQTETESRKLLISGRDIPYDYQTDITFDAERGGWLPAAKEDVRAAVLQLLERHPYVNQVELCSLLTNISKPRLIKVLTELKMEGLIDQGRFGYSLKRT